MEYLLVVFQRNNKSVFIKLRKKKKKKPISYLCL